MGETRSGSIGHEVWSGALQGTELALTDGELLPDLGDDVAVVAGGSLTASVDVDGVDVRIAEVGSGDIVIGRAGGAGDEAAYRAVGATDAVRVERGEFERWVIDRPSEAAAMVARARDRIDRFHLVGMLGQLVGVGDVELVRDLLDAADWVHLSAGDVVFRQGDPSDAAYFVVSGRVVVTMRDHDEASDRVVRELTRGEVIGELGLIERAPRSATVRSVRDTTLARIGGEAFGRLVTAHPGLMLGVTRSILGRLDHRGTAARPDRAINLALAIVTPSAPTGLVDAIADHVARFGTVALATSTSVDRRLGRDGIAQATAASPTAAELPRLTDFLHELEVGHEHLLLITDDDLGPWTRRALRRADRVVVVVSADASVDERRRARELFDASDRGEPHRMLAVCHPPGAERPARTRALRVDVGAHDVVHLRHGMHTDIERLARLASGHGIGLVLSGGGASGFAHLGVMRAFDEVGMPFDAIGACSIGAPLGGGVATGVTGDARLDVAERQFERLLDYTLPVVSLLKGRRISTGIVDMFGTWDFDDLVLPFYCVSTDLTNSRLVVHRDGDLATAIRASVSIPGLLPPVPDDGRLLVDGGVLNNLPIEPMVADSRIGTVVAVDVAPPLGPRADADYGLSVGGGSALLDRVRRRRRHPSLSAVLMRSMLVGAVRNQQRSLDDAGVDLLLRLRLPGVSLLEFDAVRPVASAGFDASLNDVQLFARRTGWSGSDAALGA